MKLQPDGTYLVGNTVYRLSTKNPATTKAQRRVMRHNAKEAKKVQKNPAYTPKYLPSPPCITLVRVSLKKHERSRKYVRRTERS